jgi:hypothetical protein
MLGGNDFDSEPRSRRHASEPSLTEMVRRARDARLGPTHTPRFTTNSLAERHAVHGRWFTVVALLVLGILIGAVFTAMVGQLSARTGSASTPQTSISQYATTVPTDTPLPTFTPTVVPASPLTSTTAILAALRDYIDIQSIYAGTYELTAAAIVQERWQDETHLTACIAFDMTTIAAPDIVVTYDIHPVTFVRDSDGAWQVVELFYSGSCSLS